MTSTIKVDNLVNQSGDNDSGLDLSTNDQVIIKTANTTALTVDASQNIGIGTSIPDRILHLNNSGTEQNVRAKFTNGTTGEGASDGFEIGINSSNPAEAVLVNYEASPMAFFTSATERMRIDSSGIVNINCTTQQIVTNERLRLVGKAAFTTSGDAALNLNRDSDNGGTLRFHRGTTQVGDISVTASSTSYNTSSDHRLKENVVAMADATTRLKQLQPKRFNFIADADTTVDGFLAHEVQSVVPEAVTGTHNEVDADGNAVMQGIDQSKLVPLLVKTIQELEARITALENAE
jgi:hypothetical protein